MAMPARASATVTAPWAARVPRLAIRASTTWLGAGSTYRGISRIRTTASQPTRRAAMRNTGAALFFHRFIFLTSFPQTCGGARSAAR